MSERTSGGGMHDLSLAEQGNSNSSADSSLRLWDEEAALQQDMQRQLQQLDDLINTKLAVAATTPHTQATVQRYRDIVSDLRGDMSTAVARCRQAKERQELLRGGSASGGIAVQDPAMEHLLRERNSIYNSQRAADSVLGQADSIRTDLRGQGRSLRTSNSVMGQITQQVPGLNYLVEQIRRKRSRDDMIVAGVIASCILMTLWYLFG
jgi:Golgi SNAP receptor complex protein 1